MLHYPEALQVIDGLNTVSIGNSVRMYRSLLEGGELHVLHPTYQHPRQVLYYLQEWPEPFWGRMLLAIAFELKLDQKLNQQRLSTETDHALESELVRFGFKAHRYRKEDDLENK